MILMAAADARHIPLADNSVQCVVTSPPYWGLRKYAGEQELVWGTSNCIHEWVDQVKTIDNNNGNGASTAAEMRFNKGNRYAKQVTGTCLHCGAWRGAYGLEPTIEMYVQHSVEILREVRRVLRPDGVCFWNIGDSYAGSWGAQGRTGANAARPKGTYARQVMVAVKRQSHTGSISDPFLKPKDLCLIPSRIALAAQADGWWVRSMIVWAKPNPMPESVTDRPTDAYEHIIMLTKSERYYWDADAVREPFVSTEGHRATATWVKGWASGETPHTAIEHAQAAPSHRGSKFNSERKKATAANIGDGKRTDSPLGRNLRNVWNFATQPYSGAHFATFPEELPRRCILAASKVGDLILDPFGGSGTTGRVAIELRRRAVLLDLAYGHEYGPLAKKRTTNVQLEAFA